MYTGIIHHQGTITGFHHQKETVRMAIFVPKAIYRFVKIGSSFAISGVCLTVVKKRGSTIYADVMPQTFRLTSFGTYKVGRKVNVETSMCVGDELGGHFIYGHVDSTAQIISIKKEKDATIITFKMKRKELMQYLIPQGSIAIDGISLTLIEVKKDTFSVSLIVQTMKLTTLSDRKVGDLVNIEADMMAKYLGKLITYQRTSASSRTKRSA